MAWALRSCAAFRHKGRPLLSTLDSLSNGDPIKLLQSRVFSGSTGDHLEPRESLEYDVCIVGAGPAGLSAAIRLKQKCQEAGKELSVCVLEKGAEVGAHILSGNVLETRALNELLPDWKDRGAPIHTRATQDRFYFLTEGMKVAAAHASADVE
eukprot:jgi/Botrbrau1/8506/Bobra.0029s0012.1